MDGLAFGKIEALVDVVSETCYNSLKIIIIRIAGLTLHLMRGFLEKARSSENMQIS